MARTTRSAATERAYLHFAKAPHGVVVVPTSPAAAAAGADEDFDEADIWGAFAPSAVPADPPRELPFLDARKAPPAPDGRAAHGSLPVKIPDWSKILGNAYRPSYRHYGGARDWEVDDDEDSVDPLVPPHELVGRRRAASLSLNGFVGRTLRVRDAVWKHTTGFQD